MVSTLVLIGLIFGFGVAQFPALSGGASQKAAIIEQDDKAPVADTETEPAGPVLTEEQIKALPDDDTVFGDANAPITLVEFSDFQCPYCSRFLQNSFGLIEENYIKTGKVKFVYRDFPLDFHPQAQLAAEAAECADEQGKFRGMHDMLFNEQSQWAGNSDAAKVIKGYAKKLGLNTKQFDGCVDTNKYATEVKKDLIDGASMGVSGTPGFFINGKVISGAMPYETVFKPIFDAELEGKQWEIQYDSLGKPSVKVL